MGHCSNCGQPLHPRAEECCRCGSYIRPKWADNDEYYGYPDSSTKVEPKEYLTEEELQRQEEFRLEMIEKNARLAKVQYRFAVIGWSIIAVEIIASIIIGYAEGSIVLGLLTLGIFICVIDQIIFPIIQFIIEIVYDVVGEKEYKF